MSCDDHVWRLRVAALIALAIAGCARPPQPPAEPAIVTPPPAAPIAAAKPDWNIFPDPTTGLVDIYRDGAYVGSITGDEPENEDPPMPRKPAQSTPGGQ
jgi:hypothetical protein